MCVPHDIPYHRELWTGRNFFIKTENVGQGLKLFLLAQNVIGQAFQIFEPSLDGKIYEDPILCTSMPLFPIEVDYTNQNVFKNMPCGVAMSTEKKIGSFLCLMKPNFQNIELVSGCGNSFCDSLHIDDYERQCPAIVGGKYNTLVFQAYLRFEGSSSLIKISSQKLAEFFIDPVVYEVRVLAEGVWHYAVVFNTIFVSAFIFCTTEKRSSDP